MTTSSGVRPYAYVAPYPFSGSGLGRIGYSGIFFEEPMFVLTAEQEIYSSSGTRTFTKYINKGANVSSSFEPNATGANLNNRANALFKNYILDLRSRMSGLFELIETDSVYTKEELLLDYFKRHTGDNPSGSVGNWLHSTANLAESGNLYDIDLREVQFQPFIRVASFTESESSGVITLPTGPVFPFFCSQNGQIVSVSERDLGHAAQIDENTMFGYAAAAASRILVKGDMMVPNNTKMYLAWTSGGLQSSATGNCEQVSERLLNDEINRGYGFFSIPTLTNVQSGIYGIQIFNTDPVISGYYIPPSGVGTFWPKREEINTSGYTRATDSLGVIGQTFPSGFHIIGAALFQHSASGAYLLSPINGAKLWYRFSDMASWTTTNFGPKDWNDISQPALPIVGNNQNLIFCVGTTADLDPDPSIADRRFVFTTYNPTTLNRISSQESSYRIIAPASPPSVDKFFFIYDHQPPSGIDFSNYWAISEIAGLSTGPEFYLLNNNLNNLAAWDSSTNPAGAPICMINNHLYGYNTSQTSSSGSTFFWQHIVFDDPNGVWPPSESSGVTVDNETYVWETRDTVFNNTNGISEVFEPINPNNFSFGGTPYMIDPRGTALDYGDGSIFIRFNAKMKGETVTKTFLGRIKEDDIDGTGVLSIFEFIPLENGVPQWVYGLN